MAVGLRISLFCMIVAYLVAVRSTAQMAPAPAVDCSTVVLSMADCLSFVTEGSTVKKPEGKCCSGLKTVLKTNADCLCETFKNSAQLGLKLNVTKAMTLPDACHVSAPSLSNCGMSIGSGAAPAPSPLAASGAPISGTGSNAIAPAPAGSGSSSLVTSIGTFVLTTTVAAASFALF